MIDFFTNRTAIDFIIGIGAILLFAFSMSMFNQIQMRKLLRLKITNDYGMEIDLDDVRYKMESVSSYYRNKSNKNSIDNITWNDLGMDDIFKKINNTQSSAGREVLYDMLRNTNNSIDILKKRNEVIEYFRKNEEDRFNLQYTLGILGESKELYTTNCLFNEENHSLSKLSKYRIMAAAPIFSLVLLIINPTFILVTIGLAILNISTALKNQNRKIDLEGFSYIKNVLNTAYKIKKLNIDVIDMNLKNVNEELEVVKSIRNKNISDNQYKMMSDLNVMAEYKNILFLTELRNYENVKEKIIKNSKSLKAIYDYVGEIDALISVASFRDSLNSYSIPKLNVSKNKDNNYIDFEDLYHPLIKNPIVNSAKFECGALITGSNASGKSTFIKSIAINSILGQSIYTVCARNYKSSIFNIYTSMALKDDVIGKESYYMAEIKSLKRIVDSINDKIPTLCFVDEILRGTNTIERIASSCEVLKHLGKGNCLCFAATHDIELTHLLKDDFENYHFEETITDEDIEFDYKLNKGRAQSRNAIKLLDLMGYDRSIVDGAQRRAVDFLDRGNWESLSEK